MIEAIVSTHTHEPRHGGALVNRAAYKRTTRPKSDAVPHSAPVCSLFAHWEGLRPPLHSVFTLAGPHAGARCAATRTPVPTRPAGLFAFQLDGPAGLAVVLVPSKCIPFLLKSTLNTAATAPLRRCILLVLVHSG